MSRYTISVKAMCETYAGCKVPSVWASPRDVMKVARPYVFDFSFPIFDESYREHLELMILRRYYTRELCVREVGRWKMFLEERLLEIMPKYNPMYKAMLLDFNPFYDTDYTDEHRKNVAEDENKSTSENSKTVTDRDTTTNANGETNVDTTLERTGTVKQSGTVGDQGTTTTDETVTDNGTTSEDSTRTDNLHSWDRYSDTPQGALSNVQNDLYLTNARGIDNTGTVQTETDGTANNTRSTDGTVTSNNTQTTDMTNTNDLTDKTTGSTTSESTANGTEDTTVTGDKTGTATRGATTVEDYLQTVRGKRGNSSYAKLFAEYCELFRSVDKMVLDELEDLFFGIW